MGTLTLTLTLPLTLTLTLTLTRTLTLTLTLGAARRGEHLIGTVVFRRSRRLGASHGE